MALITDTIQSMSNAAANKVNVLNQSMTRYFVLSMMAGVYVGLGIILIFSIGAPLASVGAAGVKALMGASFGVALTLVIFAGSELFTGNNMIMTIGSLCKKVTWRDTAKLWIVCFFGNLAGALLLSIAIHGSGLLSSGAGNAFIAKVSVAKGSAEFWPLFIRGILCNILVCLAIWTVARTQNEMAKLALIFWCLFAFIGSGYEHSIANMTIIATGIFVAPDTVTWGHFMSNMIPVTLGNILGGGLFVGAAYWFVANKDMKKE